MKLIKSIVVIMFFFIGILSVQAEFSAMENMFLNYKDIYTASYKLKREKDTAKINNLKNTQIKSATDILEAALLFKKPNNPNIV